MVQSLARVSGMGFYMLQDHATGPPNKNFLQLLDPSISETVEQAPCLLRCYIKNIHIVINNKGELGKKSTKTNKKPTKKNEISQVSHISKNCHN